MAKVKYISSVSDIPAGQKYVLVRYGDASVHTPHPPGLTITVARTASELSFLAAVHTAKQVAKHAGISELYVCDTARAAPESIPSAMFIFVPPHEELSSDVIGLDVYNRNEQNVGTIKDIALDANGLSGYILSVGKFLAIGDRYVVVHPAAIRFEAKDNNWHATMDVDAAQLKAAPEYKYAPSA